MDKSQNFWKVEEVFADPLYCIFVPSDIQPEDVIDRFDFPENLYILIDYDFPVICLKDHRDDVRLFLAYSLKSASETINENEPESEQDFEPEPRIIN